MATFTHISVAVSSHIVAGADKVSTSVEVQLPYPECWSEKANGEKVPATIRFRLAGKAVPAGELLEMLRSYAAPVNITLPKGSAGHIVTGLRTVYSGPKLADLITSLSPAKWGKETAPAPAPVTPNTDPSPAPAPKKGKKGDVVTSAANPPV